MPVTITIRNLSSDDAAAVANLARSTEGAADWPAQNYGRLSELGMQGWVAAIGEQVAGFLVTRLVASEMEILNLATSVDFRRKGAATGLLGECLESARKSGAEKAFLEVRESNSAAIALYERCGFRASGRRIQYYRNPPEDAVLMTRVLAEKNQFPIGA